MSVVAGRLPDKSTRIGMFFYVFFLGRSHRARTAEAHGQAQAKNTGTSLEVDHRSEHLGWVGGMGRTGVREGEVD